MPLGPLPSASSYGLLAFADGWRAVVDTDMRGPLATFDAGATWRSLPVRERVQAVRHHRRNRHEDNQQNEQNIDHRRHVDVALWSASGPDCH